MRRRQVGDVNVIADTGAIRRQIVLAVDVHVQAFTHRCFRCDLDQM